MPNVSLRTTMTTRTAQIRRGNEYTWLCQVILLIIFSSTEIHAAFDNGLLLDSRTFSPGRPGRDIRSNAFLSTSLSTLNSMHDDSLHEALSSSVNFAMDPQSEAARCITSRLGLSSEQHERLSHLSSLVVDWNEKINLVSRKDCRKDVVFGRHILPSIALVALPNCPFNGSQKKVVDVGTGGGFPGLPLAIAFPDADFCLVDSIGKKLAAVESMVDELKLPNVRVHHGRAEEMTDDIGSRHRGAYDVCVGRSVAALPKFCFWIDELIKPRTKDEEGGQLVYIIGGDIEESVLSLAKGDTPIDDLLKQEGASDKRILLFDQEAVASIASASGDVKQQRGRGRRKAGATRANKRPKGQWAKRDNSPKQRGYEGFKRYSTNEI
jgi:16S rRNA (guanine527-N7)-methyltransferase